MSSNVIAVGANRKRVWLPINEFKVSLALALFLRYRDLLVENRKSLLSFSVIGLNDPFWISKKVLEILQKIWANAHKTRESL